MEGIAAAKTCSLYTGRKPWIGPEEEVRRLHGEV